MPINRLFHLPISALAILELTHQNNSMPYQLEIIFADDREPQKLQASEQMILGSEESADISLEGYELPAKTCLFRLKQNVLTVMSLSAQKSLKITLGDQLVQRGKTYILDDKDQLSIGEIQIIVHELKFENEGFDIDESLTQEDGPARPLFDSTSDLIPQEGDNKEEKERPEPTSINVSQILKNALSFGDKEQTSSQTKEKTNTKTDKKTNSKIAHKTNTKTGSKKEVIFDAEKTITRLNIMKGQVKEFLRKKRKEKQVAPATPSTPSSTPASSSANKTNSKWPGLISRFFAFLLDLLITLNIAQSFWQHSEYLTFWKDLESKLSSVDNPLPLINESSHILLAQGPKVFLGLVVFAFLYLLAGFFLGRSLGQFLMGIDEESSFIVKRIKGTLRNFFALLLGPMLIFDFPIILGKRSFKEWLTRSTLHKKSLILSLLSSFIILPILGVHFYYVNATSGKIVYPFLEKENRTEEAINWKDFKTLGVRLPWDYDENFQPFPSFSFPLEQSPWSKKKPPYGLWIHQQKAKDPTLTLALYKGPTYEPKDWLDAFLEKNLFLALFNSHIQELRKSFEGPGKTTEQQRLRLKELMSISLNDDLLEPTRIPEIVKSYGPSLKAFRNFEEVLVQDLYLKKDERLYWLDFVEHQALIRESTLEGHSLMQLILIDSTPFQSFYFYVDAEQAEHTRLLALYYLSQLKNLNFVDEEEGTSLESIPEVLTEQLIELYTKLQANPDFELTKEKSELVYDNFLKLYQQVVQQDVHLGYEKTLKNEMDELWGQLEQIEPTDPQVKTFIEDIQDLHKAYLKGEIESFIQEDGPELDNPQKRGENLPQD